MEKLILGLRAALGIIPGIIETIKAIEIPGNGAEKANAVIQIVVAAFESLAPEIKSILGGDKITAFVDKVVSIIVSFLNKVGVFKK